MLPAFLKAMLRADFYAPAVDGEICLLQTHISYVVLAGEFAYKIKKALRFDFLDYSTPELRKKFCQAELELNRRFSPSLYLATRAIVYRNGGFLFADMDAPDAVDYCVVMRRFSQAAVLGSHKDLPLEPAALERFAEHLVAVHHASPIHTTEGAPERIHRVIDDNFLEMGPFGDVLFSSVELTELRQFFRSFCESKHAAMTARIGAGRIRECHGDLHLGNMVVLQGEVHAFDAIEFNDAFRFIDVLSDVAFLAMDLEAQGFPAAANRFVNVYLERAGDWEGIEVFPLYLAYRAFVRAKIAAITSVSAEVEPDKIRESRARAVRYFAQAMHHARLAGSRAGLRLTVMHGLSGSGKSTVAKKLAAEGGAILIRSDAVRKHLSGWVLESNGAGARVTDLYTADQTARTYEKMNDLAARCLAAGFPVILDARFALREQRKRALDVGVRMGAPLEIVVCEASPGELKRRIEARKGDISDATADLIDRQLQETESLTPEEQGIVRRI